MADSPTRNRLGRGLAALIGDVESTAAEPASGDHGRAQRRLPVAFLRASPRNPRKSFGDADLEDLDRVGPREGRRAANPGAPGGRRAGQLRDRRRRAALARCAEGRPARGAGGGARAFRPGGARTRHRRERAAAGSQRARGGDRLSAAHRRLRLQPERARRRDRQEPAAHRQYAAPARSCRRRCRPISATAS